MTTLKRIGVGLTAFATAFTALFTPIQELFPVAAAAAQEVQDSAGTATKPNPTQPEGKGTSDDPFKISKADELWWFAGYVNGTLTNSQVDDSKLKDGETASDSSSVAPADSSAPETTTAPAESTTVVETTSETETTTATETTTEATTAATTEETTATTEDTSESVSDTSSEDMAVLEAATSTDDTSATECTADTEETSTTTAADEGTTGTAGTTSETTPAPEEKVAANPGAHAVLTADIDLEGSKGNKDTMWYPIGRSGSGLVLSSNSSAVVYKGVFDGQGHTVKGLYIDGTISSSGRAYTYGLFGNNCGTIKNVEVCGEVSVAGMNIGLVCASNDGTIENCIADGTIYGSFAVGGIAGYNTGLIDSCFAKVTCSGSNYGAIVGIQGKNDETKDNKSFGVYNCYYCKEGFTSSGVGQGHTDNYSVDGLTKEQLKTGETAWKLQNGKAEVKTVKATENIIWGQELSDNEKDDTPVLLSDNEKETKQVCQVTYMLGDKTVGYQYVNTNEHISAPQIDYVDNGYTSGEKWYKDNDNKNEENEWKFENETVNKDTVLYSEKAPHNYTITLEMDGGTLPDNSDWQRADNGNYTKTYTVQSGAITLPTSANKEHHEFIGWVSKQEDGYNAEATKNVTIAAESTGNRTFTAVFRDITAPNITITVDEQTDNKHEWNTFYDNPSFDLIYKTEKKFTVTATDNIDGQSLDISYYLSPKALTEEAVKKISKFDWTDYPKDGITISPTKHENVVIYVKATDGAGNSAYASTTGLSFDITAPEITGISDDGNYCTTVTFSAKDTNISTITVNGETWYDCKVLGDPGMEGPSIMAVAANVIKPESIDVNILQSSYTITNNSGESKKYTIVVTDKAGNSKTDEVNIYGQHIKYYQISEVLKNPTCTEKGLKRVDTLCRTCLQRYDTVEVEMQPNDHSWNKWEDLSTPDCDDSGARKRTCRVCGKIEEENINPNGHDWQKEATIDKEPTCSSEGSKSIHCNNCDATKDSEKIPQLTHKPGKTQTVESIPATCTSDGNETIITYCDLCGEQIDLKNNPITSPGHQYGDWEELSSGSFQRQCKVCKHFDTKDGTDADHKWSSDYIIDQDATCTTDGSKSIRCTVCNKAKTSVTIPAKGHKAQAAVKENEVLATCTDGGSYEEVVYCKTCHDELTRTHCETIPNGHTWGEWTDLEMPDCDDEGTQQRTCDVCGATETRGLNASGHTWEDKPTVDVPATCTTEGSQSIHCTKCDATQESEVIPALGHSWGEWETLNAPDCDDTGTQQRKCTVCGVTETNGLEAAGHKWEDFYTIDVEPTCTTDGSKSYHCEICDIRGAAEVIPAHGHTWGDWQTIDSPDCDDNGTQQRSCNICGVTENKGLDPTGHKWQSDFTTDTEPTCSEEGSKSIHCENCSATKDSTTIPATGNHTYGDWKVLTEANCTETGLKEHECTVCGITETAPIPVNDDHKYGDWVTENDADCGNEGIIKRECERCGEVETAYIPATGKHTPKEAVQENVKPADCGHSGSYESVVYCEVCGTELSRDTVTIPATGKHNYKVEVVAPTYGASGYTLHTCTVCGYSYKDNETAKLTLDAVKGFALMGRAADAIRVGWTKNAKADGYELECLVDGKWKSIYKAAKNTVTEYRYSGLSGSTKYELRIRAYKTEGGKTYYSAYTTAHFTTNPTAVKNFKLTARTSKTLTFSWTKDASADGYIIEKKVGSTWQRVTKLVGNTKLGYIVSGLSAGTAYTIRIKPYHMDGKTALYGNTVSISARTDPSDVSGLKLKGRAADALRLAWAKNTSADGYIIEKKVGNTWKRVTKITKNTTLEYRITGLTAGTEYMFRVRSYKMSGKTALYSGYVYGTYATDPNAVSGLKLKNSAKDAVRLSWTKNTSADGYIIEMKSGSTWTRVAKVTKNSTIEFKKSGLKSKTSYTFRIKTYKMSGKTALYGATKTITVKTK